MINLTKINKNFKINKMKYYNIFRTKKNMIIRKKLKKLIVKY